VTYEFYIPWSNIGNEYSQVRETWIKKAMTTFCTINLAEQVIDKKGVYRVFRSKKIPKSVLDYFAESLCNQSIKEEIKKPQIQDDEQKKQNPSKDSCQNNCKVHIRTEVAGPLGFVPRTCRDITRFSLFFNQCRARCR
jgi:hypothetical protein